MSEPREFSLQDMIGVISRYKYVVLFITLISFFIAFLIGFYKPNIYQASSTVQIEKGQKQTIQPGDVLADVFNISTDSNLNTQKEIIKSRFLVQKVIETLHLNKELTALDRLGKKHFFYKNEPLLIDINSSQNLFITIIPKTETSFVLEAKGFKKDGSAFVINKEHRYNTPIQKNGVTIVVRKKEGVELSMKKYILSYYKPSYLANIISSNRLSVESLGKDTTILKISYTDTIAKRAQEFVNFLTKIYMEQNLENKTKEVTFTLNFINKQLEKIQREIKTTSSQLEAFKKKSNTLDIKESIKELSTKLAEYENEKNIITLQINALKKILQQIKKGVNLDSITLAGTGLDNKTIGDLVAQLQDALIKRRFLLKDYTTAHPEVKKVEAKITQLKKIIKKSIANLLQNLEYRKKMLNKKLLSLNKKLKKLSKNEQDFVNLERNFLLNSKFYSYLLEKKTEAEIKKAATINRNRVLDFAVLPEQPIAPKRKTLYIIGIAFGFVLGIIIAFTLYMLNQKIERVEDVTRSLESDNIVGAIPFSRKLKNSKTVSKTSLLETLEASVVDEFRNLRTNVGFLLDFEKGGVICISSTIDKEGKSFISAALAESIAKLSKNVLLIDTNIKEPMLDKLFFIKNKEGLSDYLEGKKSSIKELIHKRDSLSLLLAGEHCKDASELLSSKRFFKLLDDLRKKYDIIIIDTPSFTKASESKNMMSYSDVILYIVKINFSKKEYIEIINKLAKHSNVGVVINALKSIKDKFKYDMLNITNNKDER